MALEDRGDGPGEWVLGDLLGRGGVGAVYAATHRTSGRQGALKIARSDGGAVRAHWFRRERDLVARLRHPNIVALVDSGELEGLRPYLVYERVEGPTLESRATALPLPQIVRVGADLLDALGYAHDAGVVHCDVTPANVLLAGSAEHPVAKLIDFGLARAKSDGHLQRLGGALEISGTPGYLSPEQAKGAGSPGPSSDLFSCGAVLFRLLTGYAPYGGSTATDVVRQTLTGPPLPLHPRQGLRAPIHLAHVVQKLLARDPENRYPSAAAAREAWIAAAASTTPHEGTIRPQMPLSPGLVTLETMRVEELDSGAGRDATRYSTVRGTRLPGSGREDLGAGLDSKLLGRSAELAALRDALPPDGARPSIIALTGPAGVGKSALLRATLAELHDRGVVVHRVEGRRGATCAPMEVLASLALSAIGSADISSPRLAAERLGAALGPLDLADAVGTLDALIGGLLGVGPRGGGPSAVMEAYDGFERLLAVDHRPVVLAIDDADGLDEGTWEVLRAVALTHAGHVGVVWCGAEPPGGATVVALDEPDALVLDAVWASAGGLGARPLELTAPAEVVAAAQMGCTDAVEFLDGLPHEARVVIEVAAVYGGEVPRRALPKVAAAVGVTELEAQDAMGKLRELGILGEPSAPAARMERWLRMGSARLRAAALEHLSEERSVALYGAAAQWLARECLDDNASNRVRLAELALGAKLPRSAAHSFAEAGRLELEAGRPAGAKPWLERAVELAQGESSDAIDVSRVHAQLAEVALATGHPVRCEALAVQALETLTPSRTVLASRLLGMRAEAVGQQGRPEQAVPLYEEALARLGDDGDPMQLADLLASLGWVLGYRLGKNTEGIEYGQRALEVAARIHAPAFRASLCGKLGANYLRAGDWDGQLAVNREDLRLSTHARDPRGIVRANINLGVCFHNRGTLEQAQRHTGRALELARRCGSDGAAQIAANNLAMIALDDGRLDDVRGHVDFVLEAAERSGYRRALPETLITLGRLETLGGRLDEADAALRQAAKEGDVADLEMTQRARAWLEVARGDAAAAAKRMRAVCEPAEDDPHERALSRLTLAGVLRVLGDGAEAERLEQRADETFAVLGADPVVERRRWGTPPPIAPS